MSVVDVIGHFLTDVLGDAIGEGFSAVKGAVKGSLPKIPLPKPPADTRQQQLWTNALLAAAHLDGATDDVERAHIERGLRSLGVFDGERQALLAHATELLSREAAWTLIEDALHGVAPASRETLTGALAAVAMAGQAPRRDVDVTLKRLREHSGLGDAAWDTVLNEARARIRVARRRAQAT